MATARTMIEIMELEELSTSKDGRLGQIQDAVDVKTCQQFRMPCSPFLLQKLFFARVKLY
jgi:hypothetical protein